MTGWAILFWLIISFLLLHPLNRWINTHVQGVAFLLTGSKRAAMWFFWVLFLPGTLLHEFSHWFVAILLGVQVDRFSLWPKIQKKGELQMGAVQVRVSDPFRHSLIGLAPLLFGSIAVLIIGQGLLSLDQLVQAASSGSLPLMWRALLNTLSVPDVWLWIYLVFAISNAMLPSSSDRQAWWSVFIYLSLTLVLFVGLGLIPTLSDSLQSLGLSLLTDLLYAFIITITIDLFFIMIILFIELIFAWAFGRQVQYNQA